MELEIIFDDAASLIRSGSQNNVELIRLGIVEESTSLNGRKPWRFNGNLVTRIPFAQQPYDKVYVSVSTALVFTNVLSLDLRL